MCRSWDKTFKTSDLESFLVIRGLCHTIRSCLWLPAVVETDPFPRSVPLGALLPHHYRGPSLLYKGRLTLECDEFWSFVDKKRCQKWIALVIATPARL
jgi:hypothetical protein